MGPSGSAYRSAVTKLIAWTKENQPGVWENIYGDAREAHGLEREPRTRWTPAPKGARRVKINGKTWFVFEDGTTQAAPR